MLVFSRMELYDTDEVVDAELAELTDEQRGAILNVLLCVGRLTRVPPAVLDMEQLTQLSINANPLGRLPKQLSRLKRLRKLFVENCELTKLPRCLNELTRLKALFFNGNRITTVPPLTKVGGPCVELSSLNL